MDESLHELSPVKSKVLVALVAAGAALGLTVVNTGSGVNLGDALKVPDVPNPLNKVGELNPLKGGLLDAKDAAQNLAGDAKSKLPGGLPDAGSVASNAKDTVGDAKSKVSGNLPASSSVASDAKNTAQDLAGAAKRNIELPNPLDAGNALMNKVTGN